MSSSPKIISGEELTDYKPWQPPSMQGTARRGSPSAKSREEQEAERKRVTAAQIEALQDKAYKEGFELGKREGLQAGRQEIDRRCADLEKIFTQLAEPLARLDEQVGHELVDLALTTARQIVRRQLHIEPGEVIAAVREALGALPMAARHVRIFLHPEDAAMVKENLALGESHDRRWEIVDDPIMTRGGCRVMTEVSQIDSSIEHRLNAVISAVLGSERDGDERSDQ